MWYVPDIESARDGGSSEGSDCTKYQPVWFARELSVLEDLLGEETGQPTWIHRYLGGDLSYSPSADDIRTALGCLFTAVFCREAFVQRFSEFSRRPLILPTGADRAVLCETDLLRLELIKLRRFSNIPLHDHPRLSGGQVVLSGAVRIRQFNSETQAERGRLTVLRLVEDGSLRQGETAVYTRSWGNVHGLQAESPVCILLNLVLGPHAEIQRSWYFPVSPLRQREPRVLATRVNGSDRSFQRQASGAADKRDRV